SSRSSAGRSTVTDAMLLPTSEPVISDGSARDCAAPGFRSDWDGRMPGPARAKEALMSGTTWRVGAIVGVIAMTGGAFADGTPAVGAPGMAVPGEKPAEPVKPAAASPAPEPAPATPAALATASPVSSTTAAPKPVAAHGGAAALKGTVPVAGATPADYP